MVFGVIGYNTGFADVVGETGLAMKHDPEARRDRYDAILCRGRLKYKTQNGIPPAPVAGVFGTRLALVLALPHG